TVSGVFQLTATLRRDDNGALIQSTPVKIVVRAGLPNQEHFSLWASLYNFPALFKFGQTMAIFVKLGDKYSNPVEPGTAVYFNTTGGIITGDAYTNLFGDASVLLQSANPYPVGGYACVKAQTLGEGGILIQDSIRILFSGNSSITSLTDSFRVERESYIDIPITVSDQNGNPLAAGTLITTTLEYTPPAGVPNATVIINGLPTAPFGDYLTAGPNRTNFTMRIIDATPGGTTDKMNVKITVKIEGPNGITFKNFFGTVGTKVTGGDPATAFPHSIAYVGPATINLSVAGVGGTESAIITYEVRDSLGAPITFERRDTISFSLVGTPILGGAYVSPAYAITNAAGRVSTTINSGIKSGVLQLVATLRRESDGAIVSSTPIKVVINAGLPDQSYFSIAPAQFNFAGYNWVGRENRILVQVGDKYSNPVQPGTAIYFNATGGIIQAAGYTNTAGQVTNTLYSGNPLPNDPTPGFGPGYAWVTAFTLGENGVEVKDSVRVLFSGRPYITVNPTSFAVPKGGSVMIDVNISDQHGNPLAPGTQITPTIEFTPPEGTNWSAKIGGLPTDPLDDYLTRGPGRTDFQLQVIDATPGGTPQVMPVVVKIVVTGANGTTTKFIYGSVGN
ncbi:MAG: hypothetical protein QME25_09850, partial [Bacteroidota bacterium]|nr:hypothetical protein [Bacteroidota bacterium]